MMGLRTAHPVRAVTVAIDTMANRQTCLPVTGQVIVQKHTITKASRP